MHIAIGLDSIVVVGVVLEGVKKLKLVFITGCLSVYLRVRRRNRLAIPWLWLRGAA